MKIDRLIGILNILLQKDCVTAPQLAEKFEVSRRTINRDIESICQAGIPVVTRQGFQGGISLAEGFTIDRPAWERDELEMLLAGVRGLDSVMAQPRLERVAEKLANAGGRHAPAARETITINLASHYRDSLSDKISCLQRAIRAERMVEFDYFYSKGESRRRAEPHSIVYQWSSWYLLAYCPDRSDFRMFKLNRLWNLELLADKFQPREAPEEALDVDKEFSEREWLLTAVFAPQVKYRLVEEYGPDSFSELPDGRLLVEKLPFTNYAYLLQWISGFGGRVRVREPECLKEDLLTQARKISGFYAGESAEETGGGHGLK